MFSSICGWVIIVVPLCGCVVLGALVVFAWRFSLVVDGLGLNLICRPICWKLFFSSRGMRSPRVSNHWPFQVYLVLHGYGLDGFWLGSICFFSGVHFMIAFCQVWLTRCSLNIFPHCVCLVYSTRSFMMDLFKLSGVGVL
jgi:hypothetical protein